VLLRAQTDERLIALASTGNQQAFSAIYERYRRELGSHAGRIVRPDRVDDVVQHAMLAAWNALLAGAEISDLRAWLHRVTHNAALDTISRRGYDDGEIPASSIAHTRTEELAEGRLSAASTLAALAALPEGQRRALTLTAIEGRSGHDAAVEMGISESAMRQLVYRARSSVRSAVTALTPAPLIDWLVTAAGAPATPAAISLGAAGGGGATIAKIVAVIGVTAATLGATHALKTPHHPRRTRNVPSSQTGTTTADRGRPPGRLRFSINAQLTASANNTIGQLAAEQHRNGGQTGRSQQASGNNAGDQSRSGNAVGADGSQQSGTQQQSGASQHDLTTPSGANRQSGTQQRSGANQHDVIASPGANSGSQRQQSSQANSGTVSGQSGATESPALTTGQSGTSNH
jgi:RNA polymerase sigma factor (sigma-70 family)